MSAEEDNLKKAERDLSNLIDKNMSLKKDIEDYKEKIKKAEQYYCQRKSKKGKLNTNSISLTEIP